MPSALLQKYDVPCSGGHPNKPFFVDHPEKSKMSFSPRSKSESCLSNVWGWHRAKGRGFFFGKLFFLAIVKICELERILEQIFRLWKFVKIMEITIFAIWNFRKTRPHLFACLWCNGIVEVKILVSHSISFQCFCPEVTWEIPSFWQKNVWCFATSRNWLCPKSQNMNAGNSFYCAN